MEIIQLRLFDGKDCIKCGWKPLSAFGKDASKKDGLQTRCRECIGAYHKQRYYADIERSRAYELERYHKNPAQFRAAQRRHEAKNKVAIAARKKKYQKTYQRKITARYAEQKKEITRRWAQEHKTKRCLNQHKRRAFQLGSPTSYTLPEWQALCAWFGNICLACGGDELTVDHVVPLSKGGSNGIENLQPLCKSCNCTKHTKEVDFRDKERLTLFLEYLRGT